MKKVILVLICMLIVVSAAFAEPAKKYKITEESLFESLNELVAVAGRVDDLFWNFDLEGNFRFGESDYLDAMLLASALDDLPGILNMSIEFDSNVAHLLSEYEQVDTLVKKMSERTYLLDDGYGDLLLCFFSKDFNKLYFAADSDFVLILYKIED